MFVSILFIYHVDILIIYINGSHIYFYIITDTNNIIEYNNSVNDIYT